MKFIPLVLIFTFILLTSCGQNNKAKYYPIATPDSLKAWLITKDYISISSPPSFIYRNGKTWQDTTGLAEYNRRKNIGDTTTYEVKTDTVYCTLIISANNYIVKVSAFKVTTNLEIVKWDLFEDTITKRHFMGNIGNVHTNTHRLPVYLTINKKAFPDDIIIIGEEIK